MPSSVSSLTILITGLCRGGAETQAVRLACQLAARGWRCRILTLRDINDFTDELAEAGIPVVDLNLDSALALPHVLRRIAEDLREFSPQVFLTFLHHANIVGRIAARFASVPVVVSSIRSEFFEGRFRELITRITDPLCDQTTTNSQIVADGLVNRGVVPKHKLQVVPNAVLQADEAVDPDDITELRRELGLVPEDFAWLAAGRLNQAKDYFGLIKSFAQISSEFPHAALLVAGEGELQGLLAEEITKLGLGNRVRLLGLRGDLPKLMQAANGFVLSSAWEGLPNVVLEALASGLPVVATRVGGVPEIMGTDNPWLVPSGDPRAMAETMTRLMLLDEPELRVLGEQGRDIISMRYAVKPVVDSWVRLFENLNQKKFG